MIPRLDDLVGATPASRDRTIDFLRAASILVVVVGHWLIAIIAWDDGVIRSLSAVGRTPMLWLATWVCQVMPVFFFVGGYSNLVALERMRARGRTTAEFVRTRLRRLLVPAAVFAAVWAVVQVVLHLTGTGAPTGPEWFGVVLLRGVRPPGQTVPFGPLWFLAAYVVVVAISPVTVALHRRFRWWVPAVMVTGAVACDLAGFVGGIHGARYGNVVFVLLFPHQLGHFLGDGSAHRWPRGAAWGMVAVGLGGLLALTNAPLFRLAGDRRFDWFPGIGHYPRSMLGTGVEPISNAYPPTLCFLLVGVWLIGAVLLVRPALGRWLQRPGPWRFTVAVNARIMTLFLWHMTAYLLAILLLWPIGLGRERTPTISWWWERFVWVGAPAVILAGLVLAFGWAEDLGRAPRRRDR